MKKIILSLCLINIFAFAGIYTACAGCHGYDGSKKALGKSEVIKGWSYEKTKSALLGYKNGTYGKAMKGVMKSQLIRINNKKIEALALHISKF